MNKQTNMYAETRGGVDSALMGFSTSIGPILLFVGILGIGSLAAAFWATLVTATVVPIVWLLLGGRAVLHPGARMASLTAYVGLVLQLGLEAGGTSHSGLALTMPQLLLGLAAGSVLFAGASVLILLAGFLRLGNIFKMIPSTVTAGVSNGTALLLMWLALKQLLHGSWWAAATASIMLLCYFLGSLGQRRLPILRYIPIVLLTMAAGLAAGSALEPGVVRPAVSPAFYDLNWVSFRLWPGLLEQPLGHLLVEGLPGAIALALVMILESFTTSAIMETRFGLHMDSNRQLMALGGSNLVSAVLGGAPCTCAPVRSVACWYSGGRSWQAALISLSLTGIMVVVLDHWLLALPVGVVVGLFLLQAPLMVDPEFARRLGEMVRTRRLRREGAADLGFWITMVISLAGFLGNLIWACFMGIGLSALAVLRRLSHQLTAQWAYLDHYRSRRVRGLGESDSLTRMGHHVGILRLTGHVFFGNSTRLSQLVEELHSEAVAVVVDVSQVRDVDPSGLTALHWVIRALKQKKIAVVVSGLKRTESAELRHSLQSLQGVEFRIDLDYGLELCEDMVLQGSTIEAIASPAMPLEQNQLLHGLTQDEVTEVLLLGENRRVSKNEALFFRDTDADGVWLIEEGSVSILPTAQDDTTSSRLATFGPGQFVGEMGYVDGKTRSATARADTPVRALLLDKLAIATLIERQPAAALTITRNIARELSNRVRNTSAMLSDENSDASSEWANSSLSTFSHL